MYQIIEKLRTPLHDFFTEVNVAPIELNFQQTRKEFEGDITIVSFALTKVLGLGPEQAGQKLGEFLVNNVAEVEKFNVVKGFLNISFTDSYWLSLFNTTRSSIANIPQNKSKVMVEYSSPNTNKPLHLGHVRNNLLGYSVAQILKAAGHEVIMVNLVNDRGIHICKSMLAWKYLGNGENPASSGLKGDHLVGKYYVLFDQEYRKQIAALVEAGQTKEDAEKNAPWILEAQQMLEQWEAGNTEVVELWKMMNSWVYSGFELTYKKLGVHFDRMYYESNTYLLGKQIIDDGLKSDVFFRKPDSSVWIDLTADGLDQKLVLRSNGTSVYMTQDMGTVQDRFDEYGMEQLIYVVGNEQDYHFKVLQLIMQKLGRPWAKGLHHLSYGMVDLPSGKMKSREGTVVDADDLIDEMLTTAAETTKELGKIEGLTEEQQNQLFNQLGMGALKYFILKVDPKKKMLFNPAESIDFNGNTGPFIQYTHARINSVLNRAGGIEEKAMPESIHISAKERELLMHLLSYNETVTTAAEQLSPALVAQYLYDLAKIFNQFYHDHHILNEPDQDKQLIRLQLSKLSKEILSKGLALLGIEAPNKM